MCGDSNMILLPHIDRSSPSSSSGKQAKKFRDLLLQFNLVDAWREIHPTTQDFTFYSHPHRVHTRIDHIFIQPRYLKILSHAEVIPIAWSDHEAVSITLQSLGFKPSQFTWRLSEYFLADKSNCVAIEKDIVDYLTHNMTPDMSPITLWEAHKPVIRGRIMQKCAILRRERRAKLDHLESSFLAHSELFKSHPTRENRLKLTHIKGQINEILDGGAEQALFRTSYKFFKQRNKPDTLLAKKLKQITKPQKTVRLKTDNGTFTCNPEKITSIFRDHLQHLYSSPPLQNQASIPSFLQNLNLPLLTPAQREKMETPFTEQEVITSINSLKPNKVPGPDGFPALYYKKFTHILSPVLTNAYNAILRGGHFTTESLRANICMLPKPDTDHTTCNNFRPISLINTDLKIMAKILATRLQHFIGALIHKDQVGFIPSRQVGDGIRRAILISTQAHASATSTIFVSLDIKKAFDSINWSYLHKVLENQGFGLGFRHLISALYATPSAQILYSGSVSTAFPILRGTRQGCPLSPLLFALAIEPLAQLLRTSSDIKGLTIGNTEHKISLYADDALCFITNPVTSLPNLIQKLKIFSALSGLDINEAKSQILNINLQQREVSQLQQHFSFKWSQQRLKYLGVNLAPHLDKMFETNYPGLLQMSSQLLKTWSTYKLSLLGRVAAVQMSLLPKILFMFRSLPIAIPDSYLRILQSRLNTFIWANKKARLAANTMYQRRSQGGLGVPNLKHYYIAARLTQLSMYCTDTEQPSWVGIENTLTQPTYISNLLWIQKSSRPLIQNPLTKTSIEFWDKLKFKYKLISQYPPLERLMGNPTFPEGIFNPAGYTVWQSKNLNSVLTLHQAGGLGSFAIFKEKNAIPPREMFHFYQIQSFLRARTERQVLKPLLTTFESICVKTPFLKGSISRLYNHLNSYLANSLPSYTLKWDKDLEQNLSKEQWHRIWNDLRKCTSYDTFNETNFKVSTRWYLVPSKLARIDASRSPLCFRDCTQYGSYFHIWWLCPVVSAFWRKIFQWASIICKKHISPTPQTALLHLRPKDIPLTQFKLLQILFTAAKVEIAKSWRSATLSSQAVKHRMKWILLMEKRSASLNDNLDAFSVIWSPWITHFLPPNSSIRNLLN